MAAPIVGENSMGICPAWRSFQAPIRRSASSSTWASVARLTAASALAFANRSLSIRRLLKPMTGSSSNRTESQREVAVPIPVAVR